MASVLFDKCHVAVASVIQCYLWNHCSKVGMVRICLSNSEAWWTPSAASVIQYYFWNHYSFKVGVIRICLSSSSEAWRGLALVHLFSKPE